ncbi:hypothetical protein HanHA300_Chr13g0500931 [Helianthus annuus]|nr:hypothetical protein HanHA300_Chr13g0500931 [Helianthus annuus]KAJ0499403.1 hypothetical protein HanHA89_Chr13g0533681 [Helianthus annuus]KAJ0665424.1 hypothetical protein HanLR1_Chr13g0503781 [Helianthus annuus]
MASRKGKGIASSSQGDAAQQKRRKLAWIGDPDSEEDAPPRGPKPDWTSGSLLDQPAEWREDLFHEQMNKLKQRGEAFICEKEIREADFAPFGIIAKFNALGWGAATKCYDGETKKMYDKQIQEWVASLECPPFKAPNKMRLVGKCNGVKVEMSYDSLRRVAKFDDGPANEYIYPSLRDLYHEPAKHEQWQAMLDYLFLPGTTHGKLYRRNLRMEAKLLLTLCMYNVMPRRGDKMEVRFQEVPVLYMLMNGSPKVPFRFLVLNNIWLSKNSGERKIIPHCRLITALLKKYGAIKGDERGSYKRFRPFDLKNLGSDWTYTESDRFHKLKTDGRRWRALKVDARPLRPGEEEEPESTDDEVSGDDDYREDTFTVDAQVRGVGQAGVQGAGVQSGYVGSAFDYAQQAYDPYWAHSGDMGQIIQQRRPPTFGNWSEPNQVLFDHQTFLGASAERAIKRSYDRNEQLNRAHRYAHEEEMNNRYLDDRQRRMHDQWHAGQPVVGDPPVVDYTTLPPYDGSVSYPTPPLHHSQWVDPHAMSYQQASPSSDQGSSSGGGAFGFGEWTDVMTSIFGPPQPKYY